MRDRIAYSNKKAREKKKREGERTKRLEQFKKKIVDEAFGQKVL